MKRATWANAGAVIVCAVLLALTPATGMPSPRAGAGVPDIALMQRINDAWSTLDPANAAPYYDRAEDRVFFDVAPMKYVGWDAYVAGAGTFFATLRSMKYTVGDDASVHVSGDVAWGTATLHLVTVNREGHEAAMDLRWTPIWEKRGGSWLIVHEHVSTPAAP